MSTSTVSRSTKKYTKKNAIIDLFLLVFTGGLWFFWMIVRQLLKNG